MELSAIGKTEVLKQSLIFSGLGESELARLADLAADRIFDLGEFIFWDGESSTRFYIVAEGRVKVLKHSSLGKEFIIAFFGPGEMFGEVAVFQNKPYPATAQAVAETKVLRIRREDLSSFIAHHPEVALKIINVLGERLR